MSDRTRSIEAVSEFKDTTYLSSYVDVFDNSGIPSGTYTGTEQINTHYAPYRESEFRSTMTDVSNPGFKIRSANGDVIISPLVQTKDTYQNDTCAYNVSYSHKVSVGTQWERTRTEHFEGACGVGSFCHPTSADFPPVSINTGRLIDEAVTKAYANIDMSDMLLLASLGEAKKTVSSVSSILWDVVKICRAVKRFDWKYLRKEISLKQLAERYMEARYALRPLCYDVVNVTKALQAAHPPKLRRTYRGEAHGSTDDVGVKTKSILFNNGIPTAELNIKFSRKHSVSVRAGCLTDVVYLGNAHTYGLTKIASSIWELVPFSFIVDWFIGAGNLIAAYEPKPGFKVLGSWYVMEESTTYEYYGTDVTPCAGYENFYSEVGGAYPGQWTLNKFKKTRVSNTQLPILPYVRVNLDFAKLLDLGIILNNFKFLKH